MEINTIQDILKNNALEVPNKICCVFPRDNESKLTYKELDQKSNKFAEILQKKKIKKGNKILVLTTNIPESLIAYYGLLKLGAVLVNVKFDSTEEDIKDLIQKTGSPLLIYEDQFKELTSKINIPKIGLRTEDEDINIDYQSIEGINKEFPELSEDDEVIVLYTSGSTGLPKGSILTHKNFISTAKSMIERNLFQKGDKVYCVQPLYYIDQVIFIHTPFLLQGTSYIAPKFSRSNFWKDIKKYNINYVSTVPVMQRILLTKEDDEHKDHSLRLMVSTGQHLPIELQEKVESTYNVKLVDGYGMTEGTGFSTFNYLDEKRKKGSIGKPLSCCEHKIIDKEGNTLPENKIGEIMLKGHNQIKGYLNDKESTKELFDKEGWIHTGDLGYYDKEGFYYLVGRLKNLIIKGGENISTLEIEDLINKHPKITDSCAVPIPDDIYGEEIGCIAIKKDEDCTEEEIKEYCLKKKGKLKTPKKVFFAPEIPKTSSGKHDLVKVKEMVLSLIS